MKSFLFGISLLVASLFQVDAVCAQGWGFLYLSVNVYCETRDQPGVLYSVEILHNGHTGVSGARFKLETRNGANLTYVSETIHSPLYSGNTQDGIFVCYGGCVGGQQLIATVIYEGTGLSAECGTLEVVPFPGADGPEVIGCAPGTFGFAESWHLSVSDEPLICGCPRKTQYTGTVTPGLDCLTVPVETTTWGAIKSLYR